MRPSGIDSHSAVAIPCMPSRDSDPPRSHRTGDEQVQISSDLIGDTRELL